MAGALGITFSSYPSAYIILAKCWFSPYRPFCYEKSTYPLLNTLTIKESFQLIASLQAYDPSFRNCHIIAHWVGARKVEQNPSQWKETIRQCPVACTSGCIHGAFQERFKKDVLSQEEIESLKPDLAEICQPREGWLETKFDRLMCAHSVGHLSLFTMNGDVPFALSLCDEVLPGAGLLPERESCYGGVFMQGVSSAEEGNPVTINLSKEDIASFCDTFEGEKRAYCIIESWPLFIEREGVKTSHTFCSSYNIPGENPFCYSSQSLSYLCSLQEDSEEEGLCVERVMRALTLFLI